MNLKQVQGKQIDINLTGSFSGSFSGTFSGSGANLFNIPASGITGLNLSQIVSGSVSASISPNGGLQVNTNVTAPSFTGSLQGTAQTASYAPNYVLTSVTGSMLAPYVLTSATSSMTVLSSSYAKTSSYSLDATNAATASNILGGKATHIPYFITDTTLATSSLYQSGSTSVLINQDSNTEANPEALYVYQPHPTSINVVSGKGIVDNYLQLNIQNKSTGQNASSDIVATANNGSEVDNYIDMGINSQNFAGFLGGPNDSYLYSHGHDMWIGNINDGYNLHFFNSSSEQPIITLTPEGQANITGSLYGTASWALNAVQADNATQAVSASHALQANDAAVANYANTAGNGGVTSIIAGNGVNLPFGGTGPVTIVAAAGTGEILVLSGSNVTQSFVDQSTWTFNHNLGVRTPIIEVFDTNYNQVIPQNIQLVSTSSATIIFPTLESGFAVASVGGVTGNAVSSSYSLFSTYAASASYFVETDPIFVAKSGSYATTGSNRFIGNQTITGSLIVSGSNTFTNIGPAIFSGSVTSTAGFTGSLAGTASMATTASYSISSSYALSSSLAVSSSYALTASYFVETDPIFVSKSGSLATTGSNIFKGNQTISGSVFINSGSSLNLNGNTLYSSASTVFTNANIVPTQHNTQSLGTPTERWKDVWLGGGSIYIADTVIPNSDLVIESINNILTISGSAGLEVGSFKFLDNELFLKNEAIPIIIGSGSSTAPVLFNRPLQIVSGDTGKVTFNATREGRVSIITPTIPANDIGGFSVIGNPQGDYQPVINPSGMVHVTSNNGQAARMTVDGFGSNIGAIFVGRHARGTAASPTPTLSGDILARFSGLGYSTSSYFPVVGGVPTSLEFQATENYSTSSAGSRAAFYTYANGATSRSLSATIDSTGIQTSGSVVASSFTGSLFGTSSWAISSSNAQTASYIVQAVSASYALSSSYANTSVSASYASTASYAPNYVLTSTTSSMLSPYVLTSTTSSMSVATASYVLHAVSASYSQTASYAPNYLLTNETGSFATTGSNTFIGNQIITGSVTLNSGSALNINDGFYVSGNKQFQYASFYHTASQTLTSATTPLPFQFSTIENNSGAFTVELSGSRRSRITTNTTGWWNVQYSAQATNGSGFNNYDSYTWIRINETNVANSNNIRTLPQDSFDLLASRNTLIYLASGSYFEIMYGAANTLVSFPYTGTATSPTRPATPSISLVITQHA